MPAALIRSMVRRVVLRKPAKSVSDNSGSKVDFGEALDGMGASLWDRGILGVRLTSWYTAVPDDIRPSPATRDVNTQSRRDTHWVSMRKAPAILAGGLATEARFSIAHTDVGKRSGIEAPDSLVQLSGL